MGKRQSPKATTVDKVIVQSTIITNVPKEIWVYLFKIMEIISDPPEVARALKDHTDTDTINNTPENSRQQLFIQHRSVCNSRLQQSIITV